MGSKITACVPCGSDPSAAGILVGCGFDPHAVICSRAEILVYLRKAADSLSDAEDALLDLVHPLAESAVHQYLQNDLNYARYVELLPIGSAIRDDDYPLDHFQSENNRYVFEAGGSGVDRLYLRQTPVLAAGLEVWEDISANAGQSATAFASSTLLTAGVDYWLDADQEGTSRSGALIRSGVWPSEPRCVKVAYYGGLTGAQLYGKFGGSIKLAAMLTVAAAYRAAATLSDTEGPKIRERIGKYEYETDAALLAQTHASLGLPAAAKALLQPYRKYDYL